MYLSNDAGLVGVMQPRPLTMRPWTQQTKPSFMRRFHLDQFSFMTTMAAAMNAPSIISMDFSTSGRDDCHYRILYGTSVKYITVQAGVLDADSLMDMPLNFQNILPALTYEGSRTKARISSNTISGKLESKLSSIPCRERRLHGMRRWLTSWILGGSSNSAC